METKREKKEEGVRYGDREIYTTNDNRASHVVGSKKMRGLKEAKV